MTNAQIDALVAENVMGWRFHDQMNYWYAPGKNWTLAECKPRSWSPTSDWNAMGEVIAKMQSRGFYVVHESGSDPTKDWMAVFTNTSKSYEAFANPLPLAVCLAAMKAVGVDVDAVIGK